MGDLGAPKADMNDKTDARDLAWERQLTRRPLGRVINCLTS